MNEDQKKAIKKLEKAFHECYKKGIQLAGMDSDIYFATNEAIKDMKKEKDFNSSRGHYPMVAEAQNWHLHDERIGRVMTFGSYEDSGGW